MPLKFAASILQPSTKSSGPCSIKTIQQKVAPRKTINHAKRRTKVGEHALYVRGFRLKVLGLKLRVDLRKGARQTSNLKLKTYNLQLITLSALGFSAGFSLI